MKSNRLFEKISPPLILSVLALTIPEILMGSTPVSRAGQWVFEFLFYGSGVLFIREIVIRYKKSWGSVLIFGIAFGLIEEGIFLQSIFNPAFLNLDNSFGRFWGVNWVWAQFIVGYHAIFSVSLPVFITETIYLNRQSQPWLSKVWLWITGMVFILCGIGFYFIFYSTSNYNASTLHFVFISILVVGLLILSFRIKDLQVSKAGNKPPAAIITGFLAFIGCTLWLQGVRMVFTKGDGLAPWVIHLLGLAVLFVFGLSFLKWSKMNWSILNRYSVLCGSLAAGITFGLINLISQGNKTDIYSEVIFIIISVVLMSLLGARINNKSDV